MKFCTVILVILGLLNACHGEDIKHCDHDGEIILPGATYSVPNQCRGIGCSENFVVSMKS